MNIGVDFGTTNSKIGIFDGGQVTLLRHPRGGNDYIPTAIAYNQGIGQTDVLIGEMARVRFENNPTIQFCENFKMLLPLDRAEDWRSAGWNAERTPVEATRDYFEQLLLKDSNSVVSQYGTIDKTVFSVPEVWYRRENPGAEKLLRILQDLNLADVHLQSEPVCAAAHYVRQTMLNHPEGEYDLLVCDMGGGTFDVSLCHVSENRIVKIIDRDGNGQVGLGAAGVEFDRRIVRTSLAKSGDDHLATSSPIFAQLMHKFEKVKISSQQEVQRVFLQFRKETSGIYRNYNIYDFGGRTVNVGQVDESFDLIKTEIVKVLRRLDERNRLSSRRFELAIVGGFGQFPLVQRTILDYFDIDPTGKDPRYDATLHDRGEFRLHAVAKGAAQIANDLVVAIVPYPHTIGLMVNFIRQGVLKQEFLPIIRAGEIMAGEIENKQPKVTFATEKHQRLTVEIHERMSGPLPVRVLFGGEGIPITPPLSEEDYPEPGRYNVGVTIDRSNLGSLIFEPTQPGLRRQEYRLGSLAWGIVVHEQR